MEVGELVARLEAQGVEIAADGDRVRLRGPASQAPEPDIVEGLRREKAALLAYLRDRGACKQPEPVPDKYAERFLGAIDTMRARPNPPECLLWLAVANPTLHAVLTKDLPDRLERIWNVRSDIRAFQFILDLIVDAHRQAGELYGKAHPAQ